MIGQVKVTKKEGAGEEKFIRNLHKGDFFGEKALSGEEVRTANIIADDPEGVICLVIDRSGYRGGHLPCHRQVSIQRGSYALS